MNHVLTFCIVPLVWVNVGLLIYKDKYGIIKKTSQMVEKNCQVKVPPVILLEMTCAYIQVLLRGNPNSLVGWYMNHHNKICTFMLEFHVCSLSPLHSKDFQLLCASYIGLHKLRTTYAFPLSINLSLVKY